MVDKTTNCESVELTGPSPPASVSGRLSTERPLLWRAGRATGSTTQSGQGNRDRVPILARAFVGEESLVVSPGPDDADHPSSKHQADKSERRRTLGHLPRRVLPAVAILGVIILVGASGLVWLLLGSGRKDDLASGRNAALVASSPNLPSLVAGLPQTPIPREMINRPQVPLLGVSGSPSSTTTVPVSPDRTAAPPMALTVTPEPTVTASAEPIPAVANEDGGEAGVTATVEPTVEPPPVSTEPLVPARRTSSTGRLNVIEARHYFDQDGNLHLIGSVENGTDGPQGGIVVRAALYDQTGGGIAQGQSTLNTDLVELGSVANFDITISEPPPFSSYYFWVEATRLP